MSINKARKMGGQSLKSNGRTAEGSDHAAPRSIKQIEQIQTQVRQGSKTNDGMADGEHEQ